MDRIKFALIVFSFLVAPCAMAVAQTSAVRYQGELKQSGIAAQGSHEMQFKLFDSLSGGSQVGSTVTNNSVSVTDGIFSVILDFGAPAFSTGADRFLEIAVHKVGDPPGFTLLSPRQLLTSSPYSIRTVSAAAADSLSPSCVGCVTDGNINSVSGGKVTGTVANATTATTAANVSGIVPIANGGTGSSTKNFVDLSTDQLAIGGNKTFTGNVAVGGTLTASMGQSANTVYGSSALAPSSTFTLIPGLTQTINVPAGYSVFVSAGGGVQTVSTSETGFSRVNVALFIDGVRVSNGNYRRVVAQNTDAVFQGDGRAIENWNISSVTTLPPGSHTIEIMAAAHSGSGAVVSGDATSPLQSDLTVILIKN
jgi:hypothetical protein